MRAIRLSAALVLAGAAYAETLALGGFPTAMAVSRDGKFLLALVSERDGASIRVVDAASQKETSKVAISGAGIGLAFSPDGRFVYASAGRRYSVVELTWQATGELKFAREFPLTATPTANDFIGDVAVSPDGRLIYATDLLHDAIVVINPQTGRVTERFKTGRRPNRILFHPDGKSFFVTSWADAALFHQQTSDGFEFGRLRLGPHPAGMALSSRKLEDDESGAKYRLYVAAANTNNVFVVGINDTKDLQTLETLNLDPGQPAGMTPSGLAISADQATLFVTCSDANAVAVVDITETRSRLTGFLPAGVYPVAAAPLAEDRLAVLSIHGNGDLSISRVADQGSSRPIADGPAVSKPAPLDNVVYILRGGPGGASSPNFDKLAREFTSFNAFRATGDTAAARRAWAISAIAPDYTVRFAPLLAPSYAGFEGGEPANLPPAGYLWSNARAAGLTVRNYGEFVRDGKVTDPSLTGITNLKFTGSGPDRARVFLDDLKQFESTNAMPRLTILRLAGNDDEALGMITEGLSKSKFWAKTGIFVVDTADSGNGRLLVVSPYTRRGTQDTAEYSTSSVLRTVELLLGLRPMTAFDANAQSLGSFSDTPNPSPFTADKTP